MQTKVSMPAWACVVARRSTVGRTVLLKEQRLVRRCFNLFLWLLHLTGALALVSVLRLHVRFHGGHASRREPVGPTG